MAQIKSVVLAGASGNLGPSILDSLVSSGAFNITVFRRPGSTSTFPAAVKIVDIDYNSVEALIEALKGQDAVISTLAIENQTPQENLITAAVRAGVQRFIPSEFGSDLANDKTAALPVFAGKIAVNRRLQELSKSTPLTYTLIRNSAFLDWGLKVGFIFNAKDEHPVIYDGGDNVFSLTLLSDIGKAVVGVLSHPAETANRAVYIKSYDTTHNKLLAIAQRAFPDRSYTPKPVQTKDLAAQSYEELKTGKIGPTTFVNFIYAAIFAEGHGAEFKKVDNELFGIETLTESDVEKLWKKL